MAQGKKKMSKGAKSRNRKFGKANFSKTTKKGGTLTLHSKKGVAGIAVYRKSYRIKSGARRVLEIIKTTRVIK